MHRWRADSPVIRIILALLMIGIWQSGMAAAAEQGELGQISRGEIRIEIAFAADRRKGNSGLAAVKQRGRNGTALSCQHLGHGRARRVLRTLGHTILSKLFLQICMKLARPENA